MAAQWYLDRGGGSEGPFEQDVVLQAIDAGQVDAKAHVCAEGSSNWQSVASVPLFASRLERSATRLMDSVDVAPKPPAARADAAAAPSRAAQAWPIVTAVAAALTVIAVNVAIFVVHKQGELAAQRAKAQDEILREVVAELKVVNALPEWVPAERVHSNCLAANSEVNCTFTNLGETAVQTCMRGKLVQKEATGVSLRSLVMCTGKLAPRATVNVSAPWSGGFARDICRSKSYGTWSLDWDQCNFSSEFFDARAERVDAASGKEKR